MKTSITELFGIELPVVSGGMVWCSGWRLAAAVSAEGGLGLIGAGSMHPETLREHICKCRDAVRGKPFGVNVPLFYPEIEALLEVIFEENVPVVFTSGGNPALYTRRLHEAGCLVAHVVASAKFARKAQDAGVDAIVCEGFEAGGHNGRDELTTMVLVPIVRREVSIPVIAAGGIASGEAMLAAMALGADGVQIGSRFAVSAESSAHEEFKSFCASLGESATMLALKKLTPVRLIKNDFYTRVALAEANGAGVEQLREILGSKRSKRGIFEGDLNEGELEIGQVVAMIDSVESVRDIMRELRAQYDIARERLLRTGFDL